MNIQIFGTKKCKETAKALRFFKERSIPVHFVDIAEKPLSRGELSNISRSVPLEDLINREGREYEKLQLKYIVHDIAEKILEHPLLLRTPVVRSGVHASAGYSPEIWKSWLGN